MDKALQVLAICVPVFALIGLGVILRRCGRMREEHQSFLTWFINFFSLPALVFIGVARQDFEQLINLPVIVSTVGVTVGMLVLGVLLGRLLRLPGPLLGPLIFCTYWGNVAYLGFPLARSAYGPSGFQVAAIVNAFTMPLFVVSGIITMQLIRRQDRLRPVVIMVRALRYPIVAAALLGVVASLILHLEAMQTLVAHPVAVYGGTIFVRSGELLGQIGLPLALVCIGYALRWQTVTDHRRLLAWTVGAKVVLTPVATWLLLRSQWPQVPAVDSGIAVLMMAMPCAVACYVICREMAMDAPFVAAHLTISTAVACLTIPVWLYVLLPG